MQIDLSRCRLHTAFGLAYRRECVQGVAAKARLSRQPDRLWRRHPTRVVCDEAGMDIEKTWSRPHRQPDGLWREFLTRVLDCEVFNAFSCLG